MLNFQLRNVLSYAHIQFKWLLVEISLRPPEEELLQKNLKDGSDLVNIDDTTLMNV